MGSLPTQRPGEPAVARVASHSLVPIEPTLSNADLAELLARAAEQETEHRRRALHGASRAAMFGWTERAAAVLERGGSLTELWRVGPWVARMLTDWITDPPEVPEPPALRRGFLTRADVDAALEGHDDWRAELRADLQMHTTYSDGAVPLPGMVEAAAARGYEYVGITDHSKGLPIANGMDEERLARQGEEVAALNRSLQAAGRGPRVLHSIEMNLSPQGEGDMEPDALARLDLVLGAFHSKLRLTDDQTERYLAAVRNPTVHVLAHPRCRMFDRRAGLWADWPRVFQAAAEAGTAVEIDASPFRQDLDVELLTVAADSGVRISIGTDAHSVGELDYMDYGLAAAILAGVPRERILNFQPVEDVLAWAAERRRKGVSP